MLIKEAVKHTRPLGKTKKMPGKSYGISAKHCNIGMKLAKVENTVCEGCYGLRGFYNMPKVIKAQDERLHLMLNDPLWEDAQMVQIRILDMPYFRWFDDGDLQSVYNLERIVRVCERTPSIHHWLPTKEYKLVKDYDKSVAPNLVIRVSAPNINKEFSSYTHVSTVYSKDNIEVSNGYVCPASKQDNKCGSCRACWSDKVSEVSYLAH